MKKLSTALLVILPFFANAFAVTTDKFQLDLPELYGEVKEKQDDTKKTWTFSSDYGTFNLMQEQCEGCISSDSSSISDFLNNPSFLEYGAILIHTGGQVGSLTYLPIHKDVMGVLAEFLYEDTMISLQLVTKKGLTAREVKNANVELFRLLHYIEFK